MRRGLVRAAARPTLSMALAAALCAALAASGCASAAAPRVDTPAIGSRAPSFAEFAHRRLTDAFDAPADGAIWSALFVWADNGDVLYARAPDQALLPASNMKLVTLAAAAQQLGWAYQFETVLWSDAPLADGALQGPLHVRGSGDPTLGWPTDTAIAPMREWARALRGQGVTRVEGDLIGEAGSRGGDRLGDSWSWDDLPFGYAAPYAGLTFHENTVAVVVTPGARPGAVATVQLSPAGSGLTLTGAVTTAATGSPNIVRLDRGLGSALLDVEGEVAVDAPRLVRYAAVPDPPRFFLDALRRALAMEGIEVRGESRVLEARTAADPGPGHEPLSAPLSSSPTGVRIVHRSAPLSEIAVRLMKHSQNLYAEALLHALVPDAAATPTQRRRAVAEALGSLGVGTDRLQVADGSGLSRRDFVTVRTLVELLRALDRPPHRDPLRRALPIAGVDGTLEQRLANTPCTGRILAKTGTLSHARALSGYLATSSGREVIFSVIANNYLQPTAEVDARVDAALLALCE